MAGQSSESQAAEPSALSARLADRDRWPRRWWYPAWIDRPGVTMSAQAQHAAVSQTIRRTMMALVSASLFCVLTISGPDVELLSESAQVKLPFANVPMTFSAFMILAPMVLIAVLAYLHVFLEYEAQIPEVQDPAPYLFNLPGAVPRALSLLAFYWLVPLTLTVFAWKSSSMPYGDALLGLAAGVTLVLLLLRIRRRGGVQRAANRKLWVLCCVALLVSLIGARGSAPRRGLDLMDADLSGRELRGLELRRAWLTRANLERADLRGVDLSFSDLSYANLTEAQLGGAILTRVELGGATLTQSNLTAASLSRANMRDAVLVGSTLTRADLSEAALEGADLRDARLDGARLEGASLAGARLSGALLDGATLDGADLVGVRGLECDVLRSAIGWRSTLRDSELSCGAAIPGSD
jgi:hypothetical protein